MNKVVHRLNKLFVDPEGVEPSRGFLTQRVPQSSPPAEVIPNQEPDKSSKPISEGLLMLRYWARIKIEAKDMLRKFEKQRARVSHFERPLKEEEE